jgi:6-phosphofructokinase 1
VQRGGAPTSAERLLATRFGARAMQLAVERRLGTMVSNGPPDIGVVPLDKVAGRTRLVPSDADVVTAARAIGIVFGDAPAATGSSLVSRGTHVFHCASTGSSIER